MKKFIIKTTLFISPFIVLQLIALFLFNTKNGDLIRVGQMYEMFPSYRNNLTNELENQTYFEEINDINTSGKSIKYFLVGDSFTNDKNGYKNYLGFLSNEKVASLHLNLLVNDNPIQTLYALTKTDFFRNNKIEFAVVESVERYLAYRGNTFDPNITIEKTKYEPPFYEAERDFHFKLTDKEFPNKSIFTLPFNTFRYFNEAEDFNQIYRFNTKKNLFSVDKNEVFCYHEDLDLLADNNWPNNIENLKKALESLQIELEKQNVKLVFLPAPNKLTAYYDYIITEKKIEKPIILSEIENTTKKYIYVNPLKSVNAFDNNNKKDFYFYDDTHWSFLGSKAVAEQIISETK
ncbi:SGNH/GDSL hydrolase family protein [Flavobacterium sp. I3-2]|uniref:SGNH/GDSL hydrolase family protein n=1 Tax=Flavobacterium sp. I3-2 TaxID=2748319 RepID=UPI0015AC9448|nr:SGNH/GDSL hydrolase family protein [Flavobacterium sp. I3-2]